MTYVRWSTISWLRPVELVGEAAFRDGHPDRVGEALAERAGRRLDARGQAVLRVARRDAAPLPERLEVLERDVVAGQVEERVEQHAGVPGGQDEPVAIRPVRVRRGVAEEAGPQDVGHRRRAHRCTRVARVGLLDAVDRERPDGVDGQLIEVRGQGHEGALRWFVVRAIVVVARLSSVDAAHPPAAPSGASQAPGTTVAGRHLAGPRSSSSAT